MANSSIANYLKFNSMSAGILLSNFPLSYLVIAGGGSGGGGSNTGGGQGGGGGGAGGYRCSVSGESSGGGGSAETALSLAAGTYTVTVGAGGAGQPSGNGFSTQGSDSLFWNVRSDGGGRGGGDATGEDPSSGGSGGGVGDAKGTVGAGEANQGYAGGDATSGSGGGGGGGASAVGETQTGLDRDGGFGGAGVSSSITGSSVGRAGGGGGGSRDAGSGGSATDGGGAGTSQNGSPTNGDVNKGGGGGGGALNNAVGASETAGGAGGSGIVIVRYPTATFAEPADVIQATGGTVEYIFDGLSIYKIHRFTSSGTFTVTDSGNLNQPLRFATTANSTFNDVSDANGVLTPLGQSYAVVVGAGGSVAIAYPLSSSGNNIGHSKINPVPITATGGSESTIAVNGTSYRVHQFTTVGTTSFNVSHAGNIEDSKVEYLVLAGGGSGGGAGGGGIHGGGGGAGGYRCSVPGEKTGGNLEAEQPIKIGLGSHVVTVGIGAQTNPGVYTRGAKGGDSVFSSITSVGGGGGGSLGGGARLSDGGSAGGPGT